MFGFDVTHQAVCAPLANNQKEIKMSPTVAKEARDSGLGRLVDDKQLEGIIRKAQWEPHYCPFRPGPIGG
jgi:hypothetical protein